MVTSIIFGVRFYYRAVANFHFVSLNCLYRVVVINYWNIRWNTHVCRVRFSARCYMAFLTTRKLWWLLDLSHSGYFTMIDQNQMSQTYFTLHVWARIQHKNFTSLIAWYKIIIILFIQTSFIFFVLLLIFFCYVKLLAIFVWILSNVHYF